MRGRARFYRAFEDDSRLALSLPPTRNAGFDAGAGLHARVDRDSTIVLGSRDFRGGDVRRSPTCTRNLVLRRRARSPFESRVIVALNTRSESFDAVEIATSE
jgi:hypothetical protein